MGAARRPATLEALLKKPRRTKDVVVHSKDDDGGVLELVLQFRAIGSKDYDDLVSRFPPTSEQKKEGAGYNVDLFAPALISAVCVEPTLTFDDAKELYESSEWSGGEIGGLFIEALKLCNSGINIPFTEPA